MAQIDDFFMRENRVEGITDADYQNARPYVEAAQAFAQTTYQSIYIIDYYKKNFLFVSDNPLFLCGRTAEEFEAKARAWYFAEILRDERKRQKLTQQQLGERIGKKREYISSLEQGQTDMQLSTFMLIANALGLRFSLVVG